VSPPWIARREVSQTKPHTSCDQVLGRRGVVQKDYMLLEKFGFHDKDLRKVLWVIRFTSKDHS